MQSMKDDGQMRVDAALPLPALSVAERRLIWLRKRHPKMSRQACRLWVFGNESSRRPR